MKFDRLIINGKFLTGRPTAVHLVADRLVRELAARQSALAALFSQTRLLAPANLSPMNAHVFGIDRVGLLKGQLWEQIDLPRLTISDLVLNLCNLGPMASANAITMIHDAQVFSSPSSYSPLFSRGYQAILPVLGRRHRRILTVSDFSARELARFGIARGEKIAVIPNGVDHVLDYERDPNALHRFGLVKGKFAIALSNTQQHKNIGLLLRAFSEPPVADFRLVLMGAATRSDFERLGHAVPAHVIFSGHVSNGVLRTFLENAMCVLSPSTTEGFGLLPLEAMMLRCPAIVAPCGAQAEIGSDFAISAAPDRPEQWVDATRFLAKDPDSWRMRSEAGHFRASQFRWRSAGDKLLREIEAVAAINVRSRSNAITL